MKKLRKVISLLITVSMMFGTFNIPAYAVEMENEGSSVESVYETSGFDENAHGEVTKEGNCGGEYDAQYKLYEDGTAYIYGVRRKIAELKDLRSLEIQSVYIDCGVTEIASDFSNFLYLKNIRIPDDTKISVSSTFSGCTSLENITLPACVSEIKAYMFNKCTSLKKVNVSGTITKIGNRAFYECKGLEDIDNLMTTESIGGMAFYGCNSLKKIIIPSNVTYMYEKAFSNCSGIEFIEIFGSIPTVYSTPGYSDGFEFSECGNLKEVILHEGAVGLRDTFYGCTSLELIEIPNSITRIDKNSFYACEKLTIRCPEGSYAEAFAHENDIPVDLIHVHKYKSLITTEPTCTETGIRTYTCSCGDEYTEEIPMTEHNYNEKITRDVTCEENGIKTYICINCGDEYTEEIPATGHDIIIDPSIEPTETEDGKTEGSHCRICGEILKKQETIPAIEKEEKPNEPENPDKPEEPDIIVVNTFNGCKGSPVNLSITCKESDEFTFECTDDCGMQSRYAGYSSIIAGGFISYSKNYELIFPKSGEHVISVYKNDSLIEHDKVVVAEKHTWDSGKIESNPTCEKSGSKKYTCLNCKSTQKEILRPTGHKYSKSIVKNATCISYGVEKYTCTKCRKSYTKNTPKVAHKSGNWKTVIKPTESKTGKEIIECTICGTTLQERIIKKLNAPKIKMDSKKKTINVGDSCVVKLLNNKNKVKWSVSNKNIRITKKNKKQAKIKGVSSGSAYLKAKVGGKTYKCKITVKKKKDEKSAQGISYELQNTGKGVVAILKNNNSYHVSLTAKIAYYSKGKMVGTASNENYAFEKGRTCALFFHAPYDSNYRDVEYDNYKISISEEEGTNLICGSSKIKVTSNFGADNVSAEIKNKSSDDFSTIQIACVFYDNAGKAIGYDYHYADCKKKGSTDYLDFDFPYDEDYETLYPNKYKIYVNNAYTYTWMK